VTDFIGNVDLIGNGAGTGGGGGMIPHEMGGALHLTDAKANVESKITGAPVLISSLPGEISGLPNKLNLDPNDYLLIEDSAAGQAKSYIFASAISGALPQTGFEVSRGAPNVTLGAGVDLLLPFTSKNYDFENRYTIADQTFRPLNSGRYMFTASVTAQMGASAGLCTLRIKKGGVIRAYNGGTFAASSVWLMNVSTVIHLDVGDTVNLTCFQSSVNNVTLLSDMSFQGSQVQRV